MTSSEAKYEQLKAHADRVRIRLAEAKPGQVVPVSKEEAEAFMSDTKEAFISDTNQLLAARGQTHGEFSSQFTFAQKLKALIDSNYVELNPWQLEALEMIATKISRICCGDPNFPDHWDDIAGYAKLVADKLRAMPEELPAVQGGPAR